MWKGWGGRDKKVESEKNVVDGGNDDTDDNNNDLPRTSKETLPSMLKWI